MTKERKYAILFAKFLRRNNETKAYTSSEVSG